MKATSEQFDAVMRAISGASGDAEGYLPDNPSAYRDLVFEALYKLAMQGVIPPEIRLTVEVVDNAEPGTWALRFHDDFTNWLKEPSNARDSRD